MKGTGPPLRARNRRSRPRGDRRLPPLQRCYTCASLRWPGASPRGWVAEAFRSAGPKC